MKSLIRAKEHFNSADFNGEEYAIGHLSNDVAKLIASDLYLIGYSEESDILSGNDTSRYTAIVNKISGHACDLFFDLANVPESDMIQNARRRETTA